MDMLNKFSKLTLSSLVMIYCGQVSAATVTTAYTGFTKRVNDGLSIDAQGNIYASNVGNTINPNYTEFDGTALVKISKDGTSTVLSNEMVGPLGNAVDKEGNVFVANINDKTIKKVTPDGVTTTFAQLDIYPAGIAIDADNNLYVASYLSNNITLISPEGEIELFSNDEKLNGPVGITFDSKGNLYTANYNNGDVLSIDENGVATFLANIEGPEGFVIGYMTYASGNLYATGIGSHKLFKITMDGQVTELAGTGEGGLADGPAAEATFACPNGITADPMGDQLYWNEYCGGGEGGNGLIRTLRLQAQVSTHASGFEILANDGVSVAPGGTVYISNVGQTLNADYSEFSGTSLIKVLPDGTHSILTDQLTGPLGNAVDSMGNVIVANVNDTTIRSVSADGTVTVVAKLDVMPAGVAVDSADNIFVASYTANQIYRVSSTGDISLYSDDPQLNGPVGIVFDEDGELYTANYNDGKIFSVNESGETELITQIDGPAYFTLGYMSYASGYLYATGIGYNEIYRVSKTGEVTVIAGQKEGAIIDGEGDIAQFNCPNGISARLDSQQLYITDYCEPKQLRKVSLATAALAPFSFNQASPDYFDIDVNTTTNIPVLANDDLAGFLTEDLNIKLAVKPNHGTVDITPAGAVSYTPNSGYTGSDTFSYTYNGEGSKRSQPVKVTLTVAQPASVLEKAPQVNNSGGSTGPVTLVGLLVSLLFIRRKKQN